MRSSTALLAAFVSAASATIFVTEPVASTTCTAGVACNVRWNDDGNQPVLGSIGPSSIQLCTGGVQQQTCLQTIQPSLDVSTNAFTTYLPDASVGANGNMWFIKFTSLTLKDTANPTFPFTAYSAKFTLNGMTGTFNQTVLDQIAGAGGVTGGATSSAAGSSSSAPANTARTSATSAAASRSSSSSAPSSTASSGAAGPLTAPSVVSGVTGAGFFMSFLGVFFGMLAFGL